MINFLGIILGRLSKNWANLDKNECSWKKGLCQFSNIPIIYHHAKKQKKTIERKMLNWWAETGRQTDRQTDNSDFIEPSIGRGSNKINWEILLKPPTESGTNKLWKLNIPLYGLCGGPHSWYLNLKSVLLKTVATRSTTAVDPWHL